MYDLKYRIYTVDKGCEIMNIGNKLKAYRLSFNLTQEELAYKAGINCSKNKTIRFYNYK